MSILNKESIELNNEIVKLLYGSFNNDILNLKHNEIKKTFLETLDKVINKFNSYSYIKFQNDKFILETVTGRQIEIEGDYIKFDMFLYKSYCFWFDDTVINDEINEVQMLFHKFLGIFGKLIVLKQFLHEDGYVLFKCYNIVKDEEINYTVSADKEKKFGYFYVNL